MNARYLVERYSGGHAPEEEEEEQGQKQITLETIFAALPQAVQDQVLAVMNEPIDSIRMAAKLKQLLRPHAAALDTVGILPDYLAYYLVHVVLTHARQQSPEA